MAKRLSSPSLFRDGVHWEQTLKKKEMQLREHELELLQFESKMKETYKKFHVWRQQCLQTMEGSTTTLPLPDLPLELQNLEEKTNSNIQLEITQEDENLMLLLEESSKKHQENITMSQLKQAEDNFTAIQPADSEEETIPIFEALSPLESGNISDEYTTSSAKEESEISKEDSPTQTGTMRDYLSSSLGVSRTSLFEDTEIESDMELLTKIVELNSVPKHRQLAAISSVKSSSSTQNVSSQTLKPPTEITRSSSTNDLVTKNIERKPTQAAGIQTPKLREHFPADIVKIARHIEGLRPLLDPIRSLKFKFAATVMLEEEKTPLSTLKRFSSIRLMRKPILLTDAEPIYKSITCLIMLFDDIVCICSENRLEVQLPLAESWIESDIMGTRSHSAQVTTRAVPFTIFSPEKKYNCFLDQESKLHALKKIWTVTLTNRLQYLEQYLGEGRRSLAYRFKNGEFYEGEWKCGKYNGKGKQRTPTGEHYEGYFTQGKRNGIGQLVLSSTERYDGYWKLGKRHGKGHVYYSKKDPVAYKFVGNWKSDKRHGEGKLTLKNGSVISCFWKGDEVTSPVAMLFEDRTRYIGDLADTFVREGFGVCISPTEDRFYGHWVQGQRSGKGFYISAKGTEYHGSWLADQMEGQGTLCFGNDESIISGKFSGDVSTGVVKVDGEFKLNRYDTQQRLSTLQGYKWHCFVSLRLAKAENSEKSQALHDALLTSIRSGTSESIQQNLFTIFECPFHPLGKLVLEFILIFKATYHKPSQYFIHLECAVDDLRSFMNLLSSNFISSFLKCTVSEGDCSAALQNILFSSIYDTLMGMYDITHEEENRSVDEKMKEVIALPFRQQMAVCGIDEKFWDQIEELVENDVKLKAFDLNPSEDEAPFQSAVNAVRSLGIQRTVIDKLNFVKLAATRVESLLKKLVEQFGADEFLPMFCLIMMQSECSNLQSECCLMDDFMDDNLRFNVFGYMLAQLQIAAGFIASCNVRGKLLDLDM